jgi:hypothetical protein
VRLEGEDEKEEEAPFAPLRASVAPERPDQPKNLSAQREIVKKWEYTDLRPALMQDCIRAATMGQLTS